MERGEDGSDVGNGKKQLQNKNKKVRSRGLFFEASLRPIPSESKISEEIKAIVVDLISQGMTLSQINDLPGMPSLVQIKRLAKNDKAFAEELNLAFECRAELLVDSMISIAEDSTYGTSQQDRLKFDLVKWIAASYNAERYASKSQVKNDHSGELTFLIKTGFDTISPVKIDKRDVKEIFDEKDKQIEDAKLLEEE